MNHPIPIDALDSDIAILGRKGGGKSYTAKGIVERLLDLGRRVLVLDPLGVWAGLRTGADGESAGYPIAIFGGLHADLPLDPAAAAPLARIIASENLPAVIDLSELSKGKQQAFLYAFLHELRTVNRDALTIVLEEADVFAPQNPQGDDSKQLHGEIDWIARRGRFRGFRLITITQRPARLSKDVLTQCATLIAHRLPAPQDRDAVKAWVDGNGDKDKAREVFDTLAQLAVGEAWVWAPEHDLLERVKFPTIKTFDTSSTPKAGERRIEPKTLAQVDVSSIREALAAVTSEATKAAKNIPQTMPADPAALDAAEQRGYRRGYADGQADEWARGESAVRAEVVATQGDAEALARRLKSLAQAIEQINQEGRPAPTNLAHTALLPRAPTRHPAREAGKQTPATLQNAGGASRLVGVLSPTTVISWEAAALRAGYVHTGGGFRKARNNLLAAGRVIENGTGVALSYASAHEPAVPTRAQLVEQWAGRLKPSSGAILRALFEAGGSGSAEYLAEATGYVATGGGFRSGLKALRSSGTVTQVGAQYQFSPAFLEASQ